MREHASECARLPGKAHFDSALQGAVRQGCELMAALADDLRELEHRRQFDILARPGCRDLSGGGCSEYLEVHGAIEDAVAAYLERERRIFASVAGLNSSFRVMSRAELVEERRRIQSCLSSLGHDAGPADGIFGPRTRQAIASWRNDRLLAGHDRGGGNLSTGEVAALLDACGLDAASPAAARNAAVPEPVCSGETGSGCWQEIANLPGCHVWNPYPEEITFTWSGACADGRASGTGELTWRYKKDGQSKTGSGEGPYVDGKQHGPLGRALCQRHRWGRPVRGRREAWPLGLPLGRRRRCGRPVRGRQAARPLGPAQCRRQLRCRSFQPWQSGIAFRLLTAPGQEA